MGGAGSGRKPKNEVGNRYGRLTVIKRGKTDKFGAICWICKCSCGDFHEVSGSYLRIGGVKSCGCIKRDLMLGGGDEPSFKKLFYTYRRNSKARGYEWGLSKDEFRCLTKRKCHYCKTLPYQIIRKKKGSVEYIYNGVDRVDNSRGYIIGNVVSCCGICNRAKSAMSYNDFLGWIDRLGEAEIEGKVWLG